MTTLTFNLPDELVQQAKRAGVFDEQDLTNILSEALNKQIKRVDAKNIHANTANDTAMNVTAIASPTNKGSLYDVVMSLPKASYREDALCIQQRMRAEWP